MLKIDTNIPIRFAYQTDTSENKNAFLTQAFLQPSTNKVEELASDMICSQNGLHNFLKKQACLHGLADKHSKKNKNLDKHWQQAVKI